MSIFEQCTNNIVLPDDIIDIIQKHLEALSIIQTIVKCDDCNKIHSESELLLCIFDSRYTDDTTQFCTVCFKCHKYPNNCKYCNECNKYVAKEFEHCSLCGDCGFPGRPH